MQGASDKQKVKKFGRARIAFNIEKANLTSCFSSPWETAHNFIPPAVEFRGCVPSHRPRPANIFSVASHGPRIIGWIGKTTGQSFSQLTNKFLNWFRPHQHQHTSCIRLILVLISWGLWKFIISFFTGKWNCRGYVPAHLPNGINFCGYSFWFSPCANSTLPIPVKKVCYKIWNLQVSRQPPLVKNPASGGPDIQLVLATLHATIVFFVMSVRGCKRKTTKISTGGKKFMSHSYRAQTELIKWKPPSMQPPAWLKPLIFYLELLIPLINIREHVEERQSLQLHVAMVVAWSLPFLAQGGSMLSCFFEGTHKQPCLHSLKIISHLLRILLGLLQKQ